MLGTLKIMDFRIEYRYRGILEYVHLNSCENIMDALYKFYEAHGIKTEITKIEQW